MLQVGKREERQLDILPHPCEVSRECLGKTEQIISFFSEHVSNNKVRTYMQCTLLPTREKTFSRNGEKNFHAVCKRYSTITKTIHIVTPEFHCFNGNSDEGTEKYGMTDRLQMYGHGFTFNTLYTNGVFYSYATNFQKCDWCHQTTTTTPTNNGLYS